MEYDYGQYIYIFEGCGPNSTGLEFGRINIKTNQFTKLAKAPKPQLWYKGCFQNGKFYKMLQDKSVWSYDPKTNKWGREPQFKLVNGSHFIAQPNNKSISIFRKKN